MKDESGFVPTMLDVDGIDGFVAGQDCSFAVDEISSRGVAVGEAGSATCSMWAGTCIVCAVKGLNADGGP